MTESPKIRQISVRVKRTRRDIVDDVRDQVSLKRCTVKLLRYNEEELRKMAIVKTTPLTTDETMKIRNMVVRVRRLIADTDGIFM